MSLQTLNTPLPTSWTNNYLVVTTRSLACMAAWSLAARDKAGIFQWWDLQASSLLGGWLGWDILWGKFQPWNSITTFCYFQDRVGRSSWFRTETTRSQTGSQSTAKWTPWFVPFFRYMWSTCGGSKPYWIVKEVEPWLWTTIPDSFIQTKVCFGFIHIGNLGQIHKLYIIWLLSAKITIIQFIIGKIIIQHLRFLLTYKFI